jgi:Zn-dependent M32 family carboxypeptidase
MPQSKKEANPMENYIKNLIEAALDEWESKITAEDAEEIVKAIKPELEKMVSKAVLKHLKSIARYTLEKLKED